MVPLLIYKLFEVGKEISMSTYLVANEKHDNKQGIVLIKPDFNIDVTH